MTPSARDDGLGGVLSLSGTPFRSGSPQLAQKLALVRFAVLHFGHGLVLIIGPVGVYCNGM